MDRNLRAGGRSRSAETKELIKNYLKENMKLEVSKGSRGNQINFRLTLEGEVISQDNNVELNQAMGPG